ncbi:dipeptidase PepV [Apilactobacillus quenuiae]|uniref:dipeptidase PepV n=1 Tax=Apilactobacillus quenuiae TaxID=2008377 RepID=UPI000D014694|nr:dipeptidase PepV [Apilactobacillus quenuiae]
MINWKKQAKNYKDAYLKDLKELIAIDSERDDNDKNKEHPLGKGPSDALKKYLSFGERDGFKIKNLDNLVGYIEYGEGNQTLAILAHADVMPAGAGWDTDPFDMTVKGGNAYGRGVSDDKGPGLAAYYGLKIMKDNDIKPNCKIRFIIGTDEESDWTGMKHYFQLEPEPDFGFSPDAEFPVINGEKGNTTFENIFGNKQDAEADKVLNSFDSGLRENMVPRDANAYVLTIDKDEMNAEFTNFIEDSGLDGDAEITEKGIRLHLIGKSAHGMEPKNGINAGTYLATFLSEYDFTADANNFLTFITKYLHDDSRCSKLNMSYSSGIMGDLTMNVGIMKFDTVDGGFINTNFRYPKGISVSTIGTHLENAIDTLSGNVKNTDNMDPHYVDPSDPIVSQLIDVYREQTGVKSAKPEVVGGGTYGRIMKRGVAFGALFPWTKDTMHQANEFQPVDDLLLAMSIYAQTTTELSK